MNKQFALFLTIAGLITLSACKKQETQKEVETVVEKAILRTEAINDKEDFDINDNEITNPNDVQECEETCNHCNCGHDHK